MFRCLLRVHGKNLDVNEVAKKIRLPYHRVYKRGELRWPSRKKISLELTKSSFWLLLYSWPK